MPTKVLCHGVFDILHAGHLAHFKAAKQFGDYLVVSVTADQYVNKGPGRPHFNHGVRAEMVRALGIVDEVLISDSPTAVGVIEQVRPAYYVKGADYRDRPDVTGEIENERAAVEACGGKLVFTDEMTSSSSELINRFLAPWNDEQRRVIDAVRAIGGMSAINDALALIAKLHVTVVGECIRDTYRFVVPQGISSKSPSLSVRTSREESYNGGAWAIASHLEEFCDWTTQIGSGVVHEKIRYIAEGTGQRLLEVCDHPPERPLTKPEKDPDVFVIADFGHGLLDTRTLAWETEVFTALNVQANSSNFGFTSFRANWSEVQYLVCDKRELQLAYANRYDPIRALALQAHRELGCPIAVTLGPEGSLFLQNGEMHTCPAFADQIVDATGAGDAFLAITSPLVKVGADPTLISFIGNVFAGLKTKIIGNKEAVSRAALLKACEAILR